TRPRRSIDHGTSASSRTDHARPGGASRTGRRGPKPTRAQHLHHVRQAFSDSAKTVRVLGLEARLLLVHRRADLLGHGPPRLVRQTRPRLTLQSGATVHEDVRPGKVRCDGSTERLEYESDARLAVDHAEAGKLRVGLSTGPPVVQLVLEEDRKA